MTTTYEVRAIDPTVLKQLRERDDAGRARAPVTDPEGGAPLRCCLRHSEAGERIVLVSYAPLRRWAAEADAEPGPYDECGQSSSTPRSATERLPAPSTRSNFTVPAGCCAPTTIGGTSSAGG